MYDSSTPAQRQDDDASRTPGFGITSKLPVLLFNGTCGAPEIKLINSRIDGSPLAVHPDQSPHEVIADRISEYLLHGLLDGNYY